MKQILKRLHNSKSQYNRADWDNSFARHQRYLAILQKKRKPWQARSYRELGGAFIMNSPRKRRKLSKTDTEDESEDDEDSLTEDQTDDDDDYSEKNSDDEKKSGLFPEIKNSTGNYYLDQCENT
ncbi:Hypothetical predicted protein [Paramuricea clavata]|uniref:Uncharacterized protein n=1 Tax=Paramuricea clavata TaxID=317549 RepID=A0A7D9H777_PARCT|nr:Hypothetical predicted protein [Paramuricea clavata]